jgi:hypothetical protein
MPEAKEKQLIEELIKATEDGRVRWIPTARLDEFTASFLGKFSAILVVNLVPEGIRDAPVPAPLPSESDYAPIARPPELYYELKLLDQSGALLLRLEDPSVKPLLEAARRGPLHADQAIDEILEELKGRYEKKGPVSSRLSARTLTRLRG